MPRPTPPPPPRPPPPRPSPKTPPPPPGGGTGPARPYTPSQSASIIAQLAYPVNRPNALNPHRDVRLQSETPIWPSIGCLMLMVQSQGDPRLTSPAQALSCLFMGTMADRSGKFCALLVALLAGFATMPLLQPYFIASSDGLYHLYRLMEYDAVLKDGVWYTRWAPDFFFGLGMPLFNFYAPLTYYLGEVFHLLGAGYLDSLRLLAVAAM